MQCLCGSLCFPSRPCQCNPGLRFSSANRGPSMPSQLMTLPCPCGSVRRSADAVLFHSTPVPSYAFPMQYTAFPMQNNASLFLCVSYRIGSYLRYRRSLHVFATALPHQTMPSLFFTHLRLCFSMHFLPSAVSLRYRRRGLSGLAPAALPTYSHTIGNATPGLLGKWSLKDSNLQPVPYEGTALPLS